MSPRKSKKPFYAEPASLSEFDHMFVVKGPTLPRTGLLFTNGSAAKSHAEQANIYFMAGFHSAMRRTRRGK